MNAHPRKLNGLRLRALLLILVLYAFPAPAYADSLTVYIYPSPSGINWASPNTLAWSTVASLMVASNGLKSVHAIGHMNFDLNCLPTKDVPNGARIITGQTSQSDTQETSEILDQGYGLSVFLTPVPGKWETSQDVEVDLPLRLQRGSVAFINFALSSPTCARVVQYLQAYQALAYDKIYGGLQSRPRYREGAGCSAFAESVMEIAGVMDPIWASYFKHQVFVPNELLGGPGTGRATGSRSVSFLDLLFGVDTWSWDATANNSYDLSFWDPYYAYYWVQVAATKKLLLKNFDYQPVQINEAHGVKIDARNIPTPHDPFWMN